MGVKGLAICAAVIVMLSTPAAYASVHGDRGVMIAPPTLAAMLAGATSPATPATGGDSDTTIIHDYQPPHITVATPPPPQEAVWSFHEKILWAAQLVLVIVGYAGILLGLSLLKKIERQGRYTEAAVDAAASSAQAALLNAQAVIDSERAWILITVEPSRSMENSFTVMATNRGRTPARILETMERHRITVDERRLPATPDYSSEERSAPFTPTILLPGEFTAIKPFCREDVKGLCDSEERFKRIETWEEKVFLYGKVLYRDLIAPADSPVHETNWCCWYIHGRQNSGLVIAGPPDYNSHT